MSYQNIYNGISSLKTFRNRAHKLGSDYDTLSALADRAAEWIRGENHNTEGVRVLIEAIDQLSQSKRIKAMKYIRPYFGDVHNVAKNKEGNYALKREKGKGNKKGKILDFPTWETFDEYVSRKEAENNGSKEYDPKKVMADTAKNLRNKSEKAETQGDQTAAKMFADMADEMERKMEEYKRQESLAQRNAERETLIKAAN